MDVNYRDIGKRIRALRKERGLSQEQLAEMVDVGTPHISHIENADTKMSLQVLVQLCNALEVSADQILSGNVYEAKSALAENMAAILNDCSWEELLFLTELTKSVKTLLRGRKTLRHYAEE